MEERDYIRRARLHRTHHGRWESFWIEYRDAIRAEFPEPHQRMYLIERLMEIVLMGVSGVAVKPIEGG